MLRRVISVIVLACALQAFAGGVVSHSEAKDLTDVLIKGFSYNAFGKNTSAAAEAAAPAFSASIAEAVRQVPVAAGAPSFIYRFNSAVDSYERLTGVPGPLFTERALTLGKGQFDFSIGYSYIDFSDLNGTDLDNIRSPALLGAVFTDEGVPFRQPSLPGVVLGPGEEVFSAPSSLSLIRTQIDLQAHVIVPTLRYGLTNNWEIGLSIPIVNTFLRAKNGIEQIVDLDSASAHFLFVGDTQGNFLRRIGFFDHAGNLLQREALPFIKSRRSPVPLSKAAGSATGVGDITLRTKYHFWRSELGGAALGLNLQLPSGEVKDFHGTDETHLSTFLYVSQVFGERFEPRLNIGVDFNADDVDRSSFLWSVGGTYLLRTQLGLIIDFLGRSEFGRFPARIPEEGIYQGVALDRKADTCTPERPCFIDVARGSVPFPFFPEKIERNDKVDFAFGLRYALGTWGTIFFGGIVPMNDDGVRADFIPSGGIEFTY
jgi:hypothetical protein